MSISEIYTRFIQKHDTETNWRALKDFIPLKGEFILYDPEPELFIDKFRIKIGDGVTNVNDLPFLVLGGDSSFDDSQLWGAILTEPIKILEFSVDPDLVGEDASAVRACSFGWRTNRRPYNLSISGWQLITNGEINEDLNFVINDNYEGKYPVSFSDYLTQDYFWEIIAEDEWGREARAQASTEFIPYIYYGSDLNLLERTLLKVSEPLKSAKEVLIGENQYLYFGFKSSLDLIPVLTDIKTGLPIIIEFSTEKDGYKYWRSVKQGLGIIEFTINWTDVAEANSKFEITDTLYAKGGNFAVVDSSQISHTPEGGTPGWLADYLPHPISIEEYEAKKNAGTLKPNVPYLII